MIKKGDMVRWDSGDPLPAYGVVLSIVKENVRVEFAKLDSGEYKVIEKFIGQLTKIGSL